MSTFKLFPSIGAMLGAALFLLPNLANATPGECYRDTQCPGQEVCHGSECVPSPDPLETCVTADTCYSKFSSEGFVCQEGYCKKDAVHCVNDYGECFFEANWMECSCQDWGGGVTSGGGGPNPPTPTDEELYEDCMMEVEFCQEGDSADGSTSGSSTDSGDPTATTGVGEDEGGWDTGDVTTGEDEGGWESGEVTTGEATGATATSGEEDGGWDTGDVTTGDPSGGPDEGEDECEDGDADHGEDGEDGEDTNAEVGTGTGSPGASETSGGPGSDDDGAKGCSVDPQGTPFGALAGFFALVGLVRRRRG